MNLSTQEKRVATLAAAGKIDKEIAAEMGISLGTVRVYWKRLRAKMGGVSRTEALMKAVGGGEIQTDAVVLRGARESVTIERLRSLTLAALIATDPHSDHFGELSRLRKEADECADHLTRLGVEIEPETDDEDDSETADGMHRRAA